MSRNLIIKLAVILGLIGLCLLEIFPWEEKLKPGIDLAGGTSLIYAINTEGLTEFDKRTVEEDMLRILRKRIDPSNKSNIIWRPHGGYRIEIQMPLATKETRGRRETFKSKQTALEDYNLDILRVRQTLIQPKGIEPQEHLARRNKNFDDLAESWRGRMEEMVLAKGVRADVIAAGAQRRRQLLEDLSQAYETNEQLQTDRAQAAEREGAKRDELSAAEIDLAGVDALYKRWIDLEPNEVKAELAMMVGDDLAKQNLITEYMDIRNELGFLRRATTDEETGSEILLKEAWTDLEQANIDAGRMRMLLEASEGKPTPELQELKKQHPLAALMIDELVGAFGDYMNVEGRLDDPEDLKRLLRGSGVLEWRILPKSSPQPELSEAVLAIHTERLEKFGPDKWNSNEQYVWMKIKDPEAFEERAWTYCVDQGGLSYVLCSNLDAEIMRRDTAGGNWKLQNVRPATDSYGRPAVGFSFNEAGTGLFFEITKNNSQRPLGILLDDEMISAPNIDEPIFKSGIIRGSFTQQEVMDMVDKLNAGALPARLSDQPESENTIGPTLGASNLNAGLRAGFYGLAVVAAFMLIYYLIAGSLADVALFMNLLLILGVMALSRATFTMPGIAGLILTIGMAVDANVLVFERIREEQARGSSLRMAIKNGYSRAFRTILDANATTFITALILWTLASEEIKGFALTLMIGIVSSMFTALFVTRTVFDILTARRIITNNLVMLQIVKKPQVNWMKARPVFWAVSVLLVIGGWILFLGRLRDENSMFSNEFTGGTSIHAVLTEEGAEELMTEAGSSNQTLRDIVEAKIAAEGVRLNNRLLETARVQQIGPIEDKCFEIVTTETNRLEVELTVGAGIERTVQEIQQAVQRAAAELGDRRMQEATVRGSASDGGIVLETKQTDHQRVQDVLTSAMKSLSRLSALKEGDITEQGEQLKAILRARAGMQVGLSEVREALRQAADELGETMMVEATVEEGQTSGEFEVITMRRDREQVRLVLNRTIALLSGIAYGELQTQPVVSDAVRRALEGKLEVLDNLEPQNIQSEPITDELVSRKLYLQPYRGGVLLTCEFGGGRTSTLGKLEGRFNQVRFKTEFYQYGQSEFDVFAPKEGKVEPERILKGLEMAAASEDIFYAESSPDDWDEFVQNERARFIGALEQTSSFARLSQVDPSVGRRSMNDALVAVVFSLLAIIIYIWVRFGTARFGMAAVAALIHDVSIAMGLVAASAWLSTTPIGRLLLINDFKIDLPMIAGFLTVFGYSLNDTIVVFDRIRENRGKLATLSAGIVNASINQTISRTILTSVTTLLVLTIMYIWGGPGLRGFNFVLIIGIVVGTYSSVGIAAPLLYGLRSEKVPQAPAGKNSGTRKNKKRMSG